MLDRLRLLWNRFTVLEERLLAEVRSVLPPPARSVLDAQVAAISRVQRLPPAWSEISFYCLRRGKVDWSEAPSFPCTDEFPLAELRFKAGGASYRATLGCIGGHIFDVVTVPGARAVAFADWDAAPRVRLLGDPLRPPTGRREPELLPLLWQEFLAEHPGVPPRGWALHDAAAAHRVALPDGEYVILAERGGEEFLLHRVEPLADGIYHLSGCDGVPTRLHEGLHRVLGYEAG
jgi:hypothetical protein